MRFNGLAFLAGFLAVPIFHQGMLYALIQAGLPLPLQPWSMAPTEPFGVPQVLSASFFGGLWGVLVAHLLRYFAEGVVHWFVAAVFSGVALTAVAIFVVMPLKGMSVASMNPMAPIIGFVLNAAWGFGTAAILRMTFGTLATEKY